MHFGVSLEHGDSTWLDDDPVLPYNDIGPALARLPGRACPIGYTQHANGTCLGETRRS